VIREIQEVAKSGEVIPMGLTFISLGINFNQGEEI